MAAVVVHGVIERPICADADGNDCAVVLLGRDRFFHAHELLALKIVFLKQFSSERILMSKNGVIFVSFYTVYWEIEVKKIELK